MPGNGRIRVWDRGDNDFSGEQVIRVTGFDSETLISMLTKMQNAYRTQKFLGGPDPEAVKESEAILEQIRREAEERRQQ